MRLIRIGLAQMNCVVGDFDGNAAKIIEYTQRAAALEVDLLAFPELSVCGYPPEDLLLKPGFLADCQARLQDLVEFSRSAKNVTLVVGTVDLSAGVYNGAAVINNGRLVDIYYKVHLPNYGVFDEQRYFKAGKSGLVIVVNGVRVGLGICEDIWFADGPSHAEAALGGAEVLVNINASPYHIAKGADRAAMLANRAIENRAAVVYLNLVGGQDELVFDGHSLVFDHTGELLAAGAQFAEDMIVFDLDADLITAARQVRTGGPQASASAPPRQTGAAGPALPVRRRVISDAAGLAKPAVTPRVGRSMEIAEEAFAALRLGVRDYVRKNNFSHAVIGLSGGIDSALTAAVAVDALGAANVTTVFMPSQYTSIESGEDAAALAKNMGVDLLTVPIDPLVAVYADSLADVLAGRSPDITEENIQARIRGNILMALSNKFGWLLLSTGNKSEMSVGYATLYGDMSGGFAVLKDVLKTLVYKLSEYFNHREGWEAIPGRVLTKAPSAELRAGQKDSDALPEYDILDPIIQAYVEEDKSPTEIVAAGYDRDIVELVTAMIDRSEYKRRQAPPGVKITARAFGKDWRVPITNWYGGTRDDR